MFASLHIQEEPGPPLRTTYNRGLVSLFRQVRFQVLTRCTVFRDVGTKAASYLRHSDARPWQCLKSRGGYKPQVAVKGICVSSNSVGFILAGWERPTYSLTHSQGNLVSTTPCHHPSIDTSVLLAHSRNSVCVRQDLCHFADESQACG